MKPKQKYWFIALIILFMIAFGFMSYRNQKEVCKTQSTYLVGGTTYSCEMYK